jgi:hypothetical protein
MSVTCLRTFPANRKMSVALVTMSLKSIRIENYARLFRSFKKSYYIDFLHIRSENNETMLQGTARRYEDIREKYRVIWERCKGIGRRCRDEEQGIEEVTERFMKDTSDPRNYSEVEGNSWEI